MGDGHCQQEGQEQEHEQERAPRSFHAPSRSRIVQGYWEDGQGAHRMSLSARSCRTNLYWVVRMDVAPCCTHLFGTEGRDCLHQPEPHTVCAHCLVSVSGVLDRSYLEYCTFSRGILVLSPLQNVYIIPSLLSRHIRSFIPGLRARE